jgi:hypothetical protein
MILSIQSENRRGLLLVIMKVPSPYKDIAGLNSRFIDETTSYKRSELR